MNGYANSDTFHVALWLNNDFALYQASQRVQSVFALKNLVLDAVAAGMEFDGADMENVDFEELFDMIEEDRAA